MSSAPSGDGDRREEDKQQGRQQQGIPETDTDELKRFREKWKRELQVPDPSTSSLSSATSTHTLLHPQDASTIHLSSNQDPAINKLSLAFSRTHIGQNELITRFLALLEEEEEENERKEKEEKTQKGEGKEKGKENEKSKEKEREKDAKPTPIFVLPAELQLIILANLDVKSLEYCSNVCRFWYILARYIII